MHITIIANGFQEDYIVSLLNNLADKVAIIDFIGSDIHQKRNIDSRIYQFNIRGKHTEDVSVSQKIVRNIKYYYKLILYLYKTKSEIIHVQYFRQRIIEGILFTLFIRLLGKKPMYTVHDVLPHSRDNIYNRFLFSMIYALQHALIAHTRFIRNRIIKEFQIKPDKIFQIHHGVYQRPIDPRITKHTARKKFGIPDTATVILFFGIIAEYKGIDILLESFSKLPDQNHYRLLLAGKISSEYHQKFEKLLLQFRSDNVIEQFGYIPDEDVEYYFKAADVTVLPYKEASQSGVLFMSYSYGIPVMVPDLGEFPEDVIEGKTGVIFKAFSSESLLKAIIRFRNECQDEFRESGDEIRDFAHNQYSWHESCTQLAEIYHSV